MIKKVLGVKVDDISLNDAVETIEKWVWNPGKHYIVTPNPEFLVAAQKDEAFKKALNDADLSIPDGVGLKLSGQIKNHFSGVDLMEKLVALSAEKGFVIGFLGGREGVAKKSSECLQKKYPELKVSIAESGGQINTDGQGQGNLAVPPTDILFVAFGHIKQEKWIASHLVKTPAKIFMGVGGSFDYFSGSVPRAPLILRKIGLEWLFRLLIQPWRVFRQLALIQYIWLIAKMRFGLSG